MKRHIEDYQFFCAHPDFQNSEMLRRLFALSLVYNDYDLNEYKDDSELRGLMLEHYVYDALTEMAYENLVEIAEEYCGDPLDRENYEWHDLSDTYITLTSSGEAIAKKSEDIVEAYLDKLRKEKALADAQKVLRTAVSEKERAEIRKKVDKLGGLVFPGLYHGSRRVRAHLREITDWQLCGDEKDLIAAIGTRKIRHGMNKVDFRKRYGLREVNEIAPVRFEIDDYGILRVERDDEWGEKARPYKDDRTFIQRLTDNWNPGSIALIILLPHLLFFMWLFENISSKASIIIFTIFIIAMILFINIFGDKFSHSSFTETIGILTGGVYIFGPVVFFMMTIMNNSTVND